MALPAIPVSARPPAGLESTLWFARLLPVSMRATRNRSRRGVAGDAAARCPLAPELVSGGPEAVRQSTVTGIAVVSAPGRHIGARLPQPRRADTAATRIARCDHPRRGRCGLPGQGRSHVGAIFSAILSRLEAAAGIY